MGERVQGVLVRGASAGAIVVMERQVGHVCEEEEEKEEKENKKGRKKEKKMKK